MLWRSFQNPWTSTCPTKRYEPIFNITQAGLTIIQAVPLFEHLSEYKALEDEEARRIAFPKFVKRQKERLREKEASEDGGSTTSRKRKEPTKDREGKERDSKDRGRR